MASRGVHEGAESNRKTYAATKLNMADIEVIFDVYFLPVHHNISDRIDLLQSAIDRQTCDLSHLTQIAKCE